MSEPRRSLFWRILLAPLLVGAVTGVVWFSHREGSLLPMRVLVALVSGVGFYEFASMCRHRGYGVAGVVGLIFTVLQSFASGWSGPEADLLRQGSLILLLYLLLKLMVRHGKFRPEEAALTMFGFLYVGALALLFTLPRAIVESGEEGYLPTYFLLFLFVCAKASDMAAFAVGKAIGRRKITPILSPGKTWEGTVAGALAGTALGSLLLLQTPLLGAYSPAPAPVLILFALLVTMASQAGDWVESAFKRWAGVKDSGRILPSFGGMLDLTDSFHVSIPVAYLLSEGMTRMFDR